MVKLSIDFADMASDMMLMKCTLLACLVYLSVDVAVDVRGSNNLPSSHPLHCPCSATGSNWNNLSQPNLSLLDSSYDLDWVRLGPALTTSCYQLRCLRRGFASGFNLIRTISSPDTHQCIWCLGCPHAHACKRQPKKNLVVLDGACKLQFGWFLLHNLCDLISYMIMI